MAGWIDPRPNDFSVEGLRARFKSLQDWLSNPEFANGIRLGDGTPATYDDTTGVTVPPTFTDVDAATLDGMAQDLTDLENRFPIQEVDIGDDQISTPKLQANSVTANELAAMNIGVGKWIASTSYTPGSDGWIIDADGTAEFNDVTVRGQVVASEFHGAPTENMLANGDFETDTSGWIANTAELPLSTIARDTTQAHSGSASLRVQASGVGFAAAYTEIPVQPGDIIHMTAWVKKGAFHAAPNKGRNDVYVTMDFYDGATPIMMNGGTPFQVGTSWQFIERYVAVPANLTNVTHVRVGYSSYAPSGSALYIDDVVVGKAPMMEIPYVVTNEDDSHLRSLVLPDTVGFAAPHSSYPYGMVAGEAGEGLPMLDVRGPSLGPTYASMRLGQTDSGNVIAGLADEVYLGTSENRVYPTPFLRVSKSGNQTIANDTGTVLSFDAVHNDTEGGWDGGSSTYTVKTPGLYLIHYMIRWAPGTGNTWRQGAIRIDGTEAIGIDRRAVLASQTWYQQATVMRYLTVGQTVRIEARHTSGGNLAVEGAGWPQFLMVRIGDI